MSEDQNNAGQQSPTSDATQNTGGESADNRIPLSRFNEVNAAKKEAEKRAKELEAQLAQYTNAAKLEEERKAIERGEFEKVLGDIKPKAELAEKYETALKATLESELADVPEQYRKFVPKGDVISQLEWIRDAKKDGLFAQRRAPSLDGGQGGGSGGKSLPQLTAEQLQMAKHLRLTPEQYAKQLEAMKAENNNE